MTASGSHKKRSSKGRSDSPSFFLRALQVASRSFDGLRFSSVVHKERRRMAKGMSPLRSFMRPAQRKTESLDGGSSGPDGTASESRQPLGPITEIVRNPLIPVAEHSIGNPSTPRGKVKISSHGQEKFPHLENSESYATSANVTPEKPSNLHSKGKFTWQHRHGPTSQGTQRDGPPDLSTPPRPPKGSATSDGLAGALSANTQDASLSGTSNLRGCNTGGGSVPSTPKTGRATGSKATSESENGGSHSQNNTPSKSVSRSLKYGQQGSGNNSGTTGITNVRSAGSQHVITRPVGYLQAVKGGVPLTKNQNFVEHHFQLEEDASFWHDHNVQVIIRTRPISNSELSALGSHRCLKQESPHTVSWLGQPESRYTFDHVAGETITQAKLFDVAGLPMVENCVSGYNSCMFAYGQTGSGKTHTMLGDIEHLDRSPSENRGMTPRVFEYLFGRIRTEQECRKQEHLKFFCKCSFLEIYNEQITDLLEPTSTNLQMREDTKKGVYVENLSEVEVQCVQDVIQLLLQGASNRKVAATNMNRESSRSHSVFTCVVESKWENNSMTNSRYGRLHLVDLAGSERQKSSGAEGGRLKEAANINKSLSTLGLVIMALVDVANGKQRHVPYRDSKLTFLLQDSLGGNSKTIMIANVSPSSCCALETLSTLKFAQRAKFIRNNAVINEDASGDVMALRQRIQELEVEVDRWRRDSILRISSARVLALENGSTAGPTSADKLKASTEECSDIEGSAADSVNANKFYITSIANNDKPLRSIEAVLAGALRREQQAEDITKKLAAEIEQLNRLVRQREEDSQYSKMMLRFREEKIRRLEGVADGVISAESFYDIERKTLIDELQLIRGRLDRNPELTRFAMENIRLMEELRRFQEFYDGGERDVLLDEISGLRGQLLDALDKKLGEEETIGNLSTPQKRALAPELRTLERDNELLLVEVTNYQNELKECRNNLNSCLVANADLARQVDDLQATVKNLENEVSQKLEEQKEPLLSLEDVPHSSSIAGTGFVSSKVSELEEQLKEAQDLIRKLSSEVAEAKMTCEGDLDGKRNETMSCIAKDDAAVRQGIEDRWEKLQEIEMRHSEEITQLQLELDSMEDVLKEERQQRSLAEQTIEDLNSQLRTAVSQLEQAQALVEDGLKEERQQRFVAEQKCEELRSQLIAAVSNLEQAQCLVEDGLKDERQQRLIAEQKCEELSTQLSAAVSNLEQAQCLVEAQGLVEDQLKEDRQQRFVAEQKCEELSSQLSAAVLKLEEAQYLVEALEGQQLFSLNELENLQSEHTKLLSKMKQQEEENEELQRQFQDENSLDDPVISILEQKLLRAKRGKEEARRMNKQFQQEQASRVVLEKEREATMSDVETQAALAITTLQSEILDLREEVSLAVESEAAAKLQIAHLQKEVETLQHTIGQLEENNRLLSNTSDEYRNLVDERNAQLRALEVDLESAASKMIGYLAEGDTALTEASKEMEEIRQGGVQEISQMDDHHIVSNRDGTESLYQRLQDVQFTVRETEGQVRALADTTATLGEKAPFKSDDGEAMIRESEKKAMVAFLTVGELIGKMKDLKSVQHRLVQENHQAFSKESARDLESAALQQQLEDLHRQFGELQGEHQLVVQKHEDLRQEYDRSSLELETATQLKAENVRLHEELQESRRAIDEMDGQNGNLQNQLDEVQTQSAVKTDRYELLMGEHHILQEKQARYLQDEALKAEEGEQLIRMSERKAMAVLLMVEQLLGKRNELKAANMRLTKEIEEGRLLLAEKHTALSTLQQQLEDGSYHSKEISQQHQLLAERHANLQREQEALLAEKALRVVEGEAMVKMSEQKAMAAFVVLEEVLEKLKELKATNTSQAKQIQDAHLALAERDTALAALQNDLSESSAVARRLQVLTEAHQNLSQEHERLLQEDVLTAEDGERAIKLSERKAMAALVTLGQIVDGKTELKAEAERLKREIEVAHVAVAEYNTQLVALQQKLEQRDYKSIEFADQHQVLASAHDTLREDRERLQVELEKAREGHESLQVELQKARAEHETLQSELQKAREGHESLQVELQEALENHESLQAENVNRREEQECLQADLVKAREHQERLQAELEKAQEEQKSLQAELQISREEYENLQTEEVKAQEEQENLETEQEKEREAQEGLRAELQKALEEQESLRAELLKAREEHEILQSDLEKAQDEHEVFLSDNALSIEDLERRIKMSEKKAMVSLVIVDHLMETLKMLKRNQSSLEMDAQENFQAHSEKDAKLAVLQRQLEESHTFQKEVGDGHQLLVAKYETLEKEYDTCLGEHDNLKQKVEVLESDLTGYHAQVRVFQEMSVAAEQQCSEVLTQALKANPVDDLKFAETVEFMTTVREGLDGLWHELLLVEGAAEQLSSVERELSTCRSKALMLEEENGGNTSTMESLNKEISLLATSLHLKQRDLELAIEKETESSQMWEEEKAELVSQTEQSRRDCLEKEEMAQSLLLEVQRLDSAVKEAELRVSDTLASVQALTVAKEELELEKQTLVHAARQAEANCGEKELQICTIQGNLADIQARLSAAELQEQSVCSQMGQLTLAWEIERAVVENEMQEMRVEKRKLGSHVNYLNIEMEERALATLESFRRSQEALETAEVRMAAVEQELAGLEMSRGNLEDDTALLESALEEKELEFLEIKRQIWIAEVQVTQMHTAIDVATSQIAMEKSNNDTDQRRIEDEKRACETKFRDDIASAAVLLWSTEGSLKSEVQRLDTGLKQTELRVSEMLRAVKALTVAKQELELDRSRLVLAASQAEINRSEKEQELVAIQGDLAGVRARLTEGELRENLLSGQMEELAGAKLQWEVERAVLKRDIEEMRQENDQLRLVRNCLNAEVEEREAAIFESFRRSQDAFERVETRLTTMDQEMRGPALSEGNLEHSIALLDSAATLTTAAFKEKEHKYLEMQRRTQNAEDQMSEMQTATDLAIVQVMREGENWEMDKRKTKRENDAREAELRDEIAAAELKLVATEGSLKSAVENLEALSYRKMLLEEETLKLNDEAKISLLKVTEQQQEIENLRGMSVSSTAECREADANLAALNQLREQFVIAEANWRWEQELLTKKLEELEASAGRQNTEAGCKELSDGSQDGVQLREFLSECTPRSEDQKPLREVQHLDRQKQDNQVLRAKLCDKDRAILSAKKEMHIAIENLKEVELEMDKVHSERRRLTQIQLQNKSLTDSLALKLKTAEEELLKRDMKIEGCDAELRKVTAIMSDRETQMHVVENELRREKEALAQELTEAKLVANENRTEAAALRQKFEDCQATLKEAGDLVDALVRANENAKHDAREWKTEKESLGVVQGWWMPERDKLVSEIARLETNMHTQKQDIWIMCREAVVGLVETLDVLSVVDQELYELKDHHQQEMELLVTEMNVLKDDLVSGLQIPDLLVDIDTLLSVYKDQTEQRGQKNIGFSAKGNHPSVQLREPEAQLNERPKEIQVIEQKLIDLEGEANLQTLVSELTSQRDRALNDSADLRVEIASLRINIRNLEAELENSEGYLMDPTVQSNATALAMTQKQETCLVAEQGTIAESSIPTMREISENSHTDMEEDLKMMRLVLEQSRSELAVLHETVVHLQAELENQSKAGRVYHEKLKSADEVNAELLERYTSGVTQRVDERVENCRLQSCLKAAEHSYETCSSELLALRRAVSAENLVFDQLQVDMKCLVVDLEEVKDQALVVLVDEVRADHEEMRSIACQISAFRDEIVELGNLSRNVVLAGQKQLADLSEKHDDQSNQFLQLYQQELACTQDILTGSLAFSEALVSQMEEISVELEKSTSKQGFGTLDSKIRSDFEVMKVEILSFQKSAQEEVRVWTQRQTITEQDNGKLMAAVEDLQSSNADLNGELDERRQFIDILVEEFGLKEQKIAHSLQMLNSQLKAVENERDRYQTDLVVLNEQLEMAQTLADERDIVASEARQAAELGKSLAKEKEEEARILERSVEELESTIYALESQLGVVKRESERQRVTREALEEEVEALKDHMGSMQGRINSQEAQAVRNSEDAETSKTELDRIVIELRNQQIQARKSVESLQQECAEKDVQLRSCKAHIGELLMGAEKQASENQQKLKSLEGMVEYLKLEERKVNSAAGSVGKTVEKPTPKVKGAGSPFKCIGSGLEKQRSSEMDEELAASKKRVKELEAVAASRQKEVFMLNTKLAEAESMTHDVVRDLLGVRMDIASYATLLNQQQVQRIAEKARRRTVEAQEKEEERDTLRERLNEFIEERESWLEEINRRQAEAVAARVSAEKLRLRDQTLTTENEKFREDCLALRKKVTDLQDEIKKLSGQQNLQQRIHHHAKIKEENNSIRFQNEELSGKLRRMEILFTRVNDELARYRTAEGKSAFLNFDEEARLQKKLQETEENRLQLAETVIGLCTGILQAAGIQRSSRDLDPASAMTALQQLQDRQESLERELSDYKLKARIAVEKQRLSDLREFHTPVKTICTNFTASQELPSPVSSSR